MNKICIVDLSEKTVIWEDYKIGKDVPHSRSLAVELLAKHVPVTADRFDSDNAIVIAPGFFAGTSAPTSGRMTVATKEGKGLGMKICNMTGATPQKLASAGIAALVIKGRSEERRVGKEC